MPFVFKKFAPEQKACSLTEQHSAVILALNRAIGIP
jgi:hypothetical protein